MDKDTQGEADYSDFVRRLLEGKIPPEFVKELFNPTMGSLKGFIIILQKEIESSTKLSEDTINSIKTIILSLSDIIKSDSLSESSRDKVLALIEKLAYLLQDIHNKEQANKHEIKKRLINGVVFLASVAIVIITVGKIKLDGSKFSKA